MADIKGTALATPQPPIVEWVKGQGFTTVNVWEGPTKDSVMGELPGLQAAGYTRVRAYSPDGVKWRIEASAPIEDGAGGEPEPSDVWELAGLGQSADIINHPTFANIATVELNKVLNAINNPDQYVTQGPALTDTDAIELYHLLTRKITSYTYDMPILRHTQTPAVSASAGIYQFVYLAADLPGTITPIVATLVDVLSASPPFGGINVGDLDGHNWGWLRQFPNVTEDVYGRSRLTEEWHLGMWPVSLYPLVS
jgi:hypothetical protein